MSNQRKENRQQRRIREGKDKNLSATKRRTADSYVTAVLLPVIACIMAVACIIAFMYSYIFAFVSLAVFACLMIIVYIISNYDKS
jgi:VIT1/CCC1 family predicted Fe2+/Mn2+ transporter